MIEQQLQSFADELKRVQASNEAGTTAALEQDRDKDKQELRDLATKIDRLESQVHKLCSPATSCSLSRQSRTSEQERILLEAKHREDMLRRELAEKERLLEVRERQMRAELATAVEEAKRKGWLEAQAEHGPRMQTRDLPTDSESLC